MKRGCNLCLMASSFHSSASHHNCCPSMDLNLVALIMLKGKLFNKKHIDISTSCKNGHFNESLAQMLVSCGR